QDDVRDLPFYGFEGRSTIGRLRDCVPERFEDLADHQTVRLLVVHHEDTRALHRHILPPPRRPGRHRGALEPSPAFGAVRLGMEGLTGENRRARAAVKHRRATARRGTGPGALPTKR